MPQRLRALALDRKPCGSPPGESLEQHRSGLRAVARDVAVFAEEDVAFVDPHQRALSCESIFGV